MKNLNYLTLVFIAVIFLSACTKNNDMSDKTRGSGNDTIHSKTDRTKVDDASDSSGHMSNSGMLDFHGPMQAMMDDLHKIQPSNNPDFDFAYMMIPHHKAAVDMALSYIANGKDENLKKMAKEMIDKQQKEITELELWIEKQNKPAAGAEGQYKEAMDKNMNSMMSKMNMKMSGDPDKDFAEMMSGHHKDAIDMANTEIQFGKDSKMKGMADKMKKDQEKEINDMQKWISEHK